MEKNRFTICANNYIDCLRQEGRYSTAHVYKHAIRSFSQFCGTQSITFSKINRKTLKRYSNYLMASRLKPNTISTYMRMLRSIYNRGVEAGSAPYVPRLFHDVYTGVDIRQKKALSVTELHKLLYEDPKSERLRRTQTIAALMFQFCGMSFADLAHLEKSALDRNVLQYNRIKTKTPMSLEILESAKEMMNQLRSNKPALPDCPDYLFDILHSDKKRKDEKAYKEWKESGEYSSKYSVVVYSVMSELDKYSMLYEDLQPYIPTLKRDGLTIVPWKDSYKEVLGSFIASGIRYLYGV